MSTYAIYARKSTESEDRQVLSIESQIRELRQLAGRLGLGVGEVFVEHKSAKAPGRPIFNKIFTLIDNGKINGLLCWKLDRLARNPIDGGAIIWAMEEEKLEAIHTPHGSFHNTGNDKFWVQLEFGMAKKYVDDLRDNVRRGFRAKLEQGWYPCRPPLGYMNDPVTRTIVKDPDRFELIRKLWQLMATGAYSVSELVRIARDCWGLRNRTTRSTVGGPLCHSGIYALFHNPFYYGAMRHAGKIYPGKHEPMISKHEFDKVQARLSRPDHGRGKKALFFTYKGLMKCGECGCSITVQRKMKPSGRRYIYYNCTKQRRHLHCQQRVIEETALELEMVAFIRSIRISNNLWWWARDTLAGQGDHQTEQFETVTKSLRRRVSGCSKELNQLLVMRLRSLLTDTEYTEKRKELTEEKVLLERRLSHHLAHPVTAPADAALLRRPSGSILRTFLRGSDETKRSLVMLLGKEFRLLDKSLHARPVPAFAKD